MRHTFIAILLLASVAGAQTTGIPGFNDYTLNGAVSGSTSCTGLTFATPLTLDMQVSTVASTSVFLLFNPAPCSPAALALPTCQGSTLDLTFPGITAIGPMLSDSAGIATMSVAIPALATAITFSTQAVMFPCGTLPLFSQAYDVVLTP